MWSPSVSAYRRAGTQACPYNAAMMHPQPPRRLEQRRCHGALRIHRITPLFIPHARCETYFQKGAETLSGLSPLSQTTSGTAAGARSPSHREATAASVIRRAGGYGLWAPKSCCLRAWR